ncbi:hypothetical protein BCR39DRAFT_556784 [Naematelia encephala]|uniref:Uncharacterized protein n=1 Tax=Naematelia encephala TaxID=71784 RepID=A0A1Y2BGP9_9TREE|nr:hypothetical protein BCR39DRAFT_556784 [Naematelia encephala]
MVSDLTSSLGTPLDRDFEVENRQLRERINALEEAVWQLQQKVTIREDSTTALLSGPNTLSPQVVSLALGLLCGVFQSSQPAPFQNGLTNLLIVTATVFFHLPPSPRDREVYSALSTSLALLLSTYDSTTVIDPYDYIDQLDFFAPPDIIWLFVHTADHALILTFRQVLRREIIMFPGTRRGLTCEVLYHALLPEINHGVGWFSKEEKVYVRVMAQLRGWKLGGDGLQRVDWEFIEDVIRPYGPEGKRNIVSGIEKSDSTGYTKRQKVEGWQQSIDGETLDS